MRPMFLCSQSHVYLLFIVQLVRPFDFGAKFVLPNAFIELDAVLNDSARLLFLGMVASGCTCNPILPLAFVDLSLYDLPV